MSQHKSSLHEIAKGPDAIKAARAEPIVQNPAPRTQSMDFIRSLVLDIPMQTTSVSEGLNIERMLEAQLEAETRKLEKSTDLDDYVSFDIPLLIRVFELVREGIKSDVELHKLVERLNSLRSKGVLTMDDYGVIAGDNIQGTEKEYAPSAVAADQQDESIDMIKKLAGIR